MPRITGTRQPKETAKAKAPKADRAEKKPSTRSASSAASGGEGPSSSGRSEIYTSSYSGGGEGASPAPARRSEPVVYPSRNVWSSGGGGE